MKKLFPFLIVCSLLCAALNEPTSVVINGGSLGENYGLACDSYTGYCLNNITSGGKLWSHVSALDQSDSVISLSMVGGASPVAPSDSTNKKFYVYYYGTSAWDDIAVFSNVYAKLEGSTTATGTIILTVW